MRIVKQGEPGRWLGLIHARCARAREHHGPGHLSVSLAGSIIAATRRRVRPSLSRLSRPVLAGTVLGTATISNAAEGRRTGTNA